ncbi:MAG: ATP-binding protein [Candidatus Promineifilaceae bacterium]
MRSLTFKLILAFLVVALTGVALVAILAVRTTAAQFDKFVVERNREDLVEQFGNFFLAYGSWEGVTEALPFFGTGGSPAPFRDLIQGEERAGLRGGSPIAVVDSEGTVVIPGMGYQVGVVASESNRDDGTPILVNGEQVGLLLQGSNPIGRTLAGAEALFLSRVNRVLFIGAIGAAVVALLLGILLARTLSRPIRELTAATRAVALGDLEQKVPVRSQDELGELATSFNQMSADLTKARELRRQMTADIAHDLRTPLSIILGHSEALSEGVLPPSSETYHVLHEEAKRLSRMVDELRTLSLAEAGELDLVLRPISPEDLLARTVAAFLPQAEKKGVELVLDAGHDLPDVDVDPDRIAQVLDNLMSNALRFTPEGGRVQLSAKGDRGQVQLIVEDDGPGVPAEEVSYIFSRFYRGDKARSGQEGSSGLGLAIARSIVEAHGGRISAASEQGQGVRFIVELPAAG